MSQRTPPNVRIALLDSHTEARFRRPIDAEMYSMAGLFAFRALNRHDTWNEKVLPYTTVALRETTARQGPFLHVRTLCSLTELVQDYTMRLEQELELGSVHALAHSASYVFECSHANLERGHDREFGIQLRRISEASGRNTSFVQ